MKNKLPLAFEDYQLTELIGTGGIADVYKGRHPEEHHKTPVDLAIKIVRDNIDRTLASNQISLQASAHKKLDGLEGVVQVMEHDANHKSPYLVSEFIEGETLDKKIEKQALQVHQAIKYLVKIIDVLQKAYKKEVIHGDLSLSNILINAADEVKITDFQNYRGQQNADLINSLPMSSSMSVHTQGYAAPEVLQNGTINEKSDIYSLGKIFFALLGKNPLDGTRKLPSQITEDIADIYDRCVALNPDERYSSYEELKNDLLVIHDPNTISPEKEENVVQEQEIYYTHTPKESTLQRLKKEVEDPSNDREIRRKQQEALERLKTWEDQIHEAPNETLKKKYQQHWADTIYGWERHFAIDDFAKHNLPTQIIFSVKEHYYPFFKDEEPTTKLKNIQKWVQGDPAHKSTHDSLRKAHQCSDQIKARIYYYMSKIFDIGAYNKIEPIPTWFIKGLSPQQQQKHAQKALAKSEEEIQKLTTIVREGFGIAENKENETLDELHHLRLECEKMSFLEKLRSRRKVQKLKKFQQAQEVIQKRDNELECNIRLKKELKKLDTYIEYEQEILDLVAKVNKARSDLNESFIEKKILPGLQILLPVHGKLITPEQASLFLNSLEGFVGGFSDEFCQKFSQIISEDMYPSYKKAAEIAEALDIPHNFPFPKPNK